MHLKTITLSVLFLLINLTSNAQISDLKNWLKVDYASRLPLDSLTFSKKALTKQEAKLATALLVADKKSRITDTYDKQWENRLINYDTHQMPFYFQIFGKEPADGRNLFISMHGGGNAPAALNDKQYENQKHLYDKTMDSLEGVYLAARAPTNTWNLWHENHIDDFFNILIQMAVIKLNVNPNKVYLLGYSAGGDGVYQLAPRIADRWAAASMMAGHPNETSPLGLRNLPFALHMGALDKAYNRNGIAQQWGTQLDSLQQTDNDGYIHQVELHEGLEHWMKLQDAVAFPWMINYKRNPIPQKVVWKQDDRHHSSIYWIKTPKNHTKTGGVISAEYNSSLNEINIIENYSETLELLINDDMLDLDKPVTIKRQNNIIHQGKFDRNILNIYNSLQYKGDINLTFPGIIKINDDEVITNK
ncbi:hypothetical protein JQC67_18890 [Aurantibacter crassamenti]|uniref:hypothetical protein n=1 Tax=Aurantibacter crassamenti TaxID=1837375 RepID=UPI00193A5F4D|nr:hypothetical protein [Aurantibacter crassamenti]MBM1108227.1 hypothetical protein [Aurantibacter crassamenti]